MSQDPEEHPLPGTASIGKLVWKIHRHNASYIDKRLREFGLGVGQFRHLLTIYRREGLNQGELAALLELDKTTTARALGKLVEAGMVRREIDPEDNRAYLLCLTDEGRQAVPEVKGILEESTDRLARGFSAFERENLLRYLGRILRNLGFGEEILNGEEVFDGGEKEDE